MHDVSHTKECANVGDCLAGWPYVDLGHFQVIQHASFVYAFMSENNDFWHCSKNLLGQDGGTSMTELVKDMVDIA